jgi:hypothetical protein
MVAPTVMPVPTVREWDTNPTLKVRGRKSSGRRPLHTKKAPIA